LELSTPFRRLPFPHTVGLDSFYTGPPFRNKDSSDVVPAPHRGDLSGCNVLSGAAKLVRLPAKMNGLERSSIPHPSNLKGFTFRKVGRRGRGKGGRGGGGK
jgi:hypothetical protein